jgi:hypothetical protein
MIPRVWQEVPRVVQRSQCDKQKPCFIDTCQHWILWMCKEAMFDGSKTSQKKYFIQTSLQSTYLLPNVFQVLWKFRVFFAFISFLSSGNLSMVDLSTTYRLTSDVQVCRGTRVAFSQDVGIQPFGWWAFLDVENANSPLLCTKLRVFTGS